MNGPTREGRTAEDLEWNAALADLIRGVEQAKGAIARVEDAVQRVRIAGQRRQESEPRLIDGLSPRARADTVLGWLRYAIQSQGTTSVAQMLRYTYDLESAFEDLVREQAADHAR